MTYQQTLEYLFAQLPMYHRIGAAAYKADLTNILKISELLNKPHQKLKFIHVAGTNGKGSSSHMLAAILQKCGYKTGLYTSPHLVDFRERVKVNGKMIPKNYVIDFVEKYKAQFDEIEPSFFEWTFGLALDYFKHEEVDVAIIEVGLGGRLDSTNIILPQVSLITNISFDHQNLLGDTLEKIAIEKAGIIKARTPVVVSQYQPETAPVFSNRAREIKAPIEFAEKNYKVLEQKILNNLLSITLQNKKTNAQEHYELDLIGSYQIKNLMGVLNTLEHIEKAGYIIEKENIIAALREVASSTGLQGRWQVKEQKPLLVLDTAHNEDGIKQVLEHLKTIAFKNLHYVFGMVNDKDVTKVLSLLPKEGTYYFVKANIPRAVEPSILLEEAKKLNLLAKAFETVELGINAAKKLAKKSDLILVGGSNFVVGDALEVLG